MPGPIPAFVGTLKRPLLNGIAIALLVAIYTLFIPNTYRSDVRILPEAKSGAGLGSLAAAAAAFGVGGAVPEGAEANFADIVKSRYVQEKILDTEFHFHEKNNFLGSMHEKRMTLRTYFKAKTTDRGLLKLNSIIFVNKDLKSKMILISAETKSAELSQAVVNRTKDLLEEFLKEKSKTRGGVKADFAQQRLLAAKNDYSMAESSFRQFLDQNRNYLASPDPTIRLAGMRYETDLRLRQQLVLSISMNLEQALMDEKNDMPILNVMDDGALPTDKSGPERSPLVLMAFVFGFAGTLGWRSRGWLLSHFQLED